MKRFDVISVVPGENADEDKEVEENDRLPCKEESENGERPAIDENSGTSKAESEIVSVETNDEGSTVNEVSSKFDDHKSEGVVKLYVEIAVISL